ncbi:MAG: flagellar assembly peptidoglycan hydrolase FlgJ, partial [Shewanella sp.]
YTQFYQGMLDEQRVAQMADRGGLGVADLVVKQFSGQTFTHQDGRVLKLPMRTERVLKPYQPPNTVSNEIIDASKLGKELALKDNAWQRSSVSVKDAPLRARTIPAIGVAQEGGALSQGATPTRFNSPAEFVKHLMPLAKKAAQKMGLHPAVLVAQAALESSWGKRVITDPQGGMSYNLFGIKADPRWQGAKAVVSTLEYEQGVAARQKAAFRSYDSFEESFNDYVDFISQGPRYQQALAKVSEPSHYFDALQRAGYATDPHYASKLKKILQSDALSRYHDMEP